MGEGTVATTENTPNMTTSSGSNMSAMFKDLAIEQRRKNQAVYNVFERFQMMALYRMQHKITKRLGIMPEDVYDWNDKAWSDAQDELKEYLEGLSRLQWTTTLRRLKAGNPIDEHRTLLIQKFDEHAYCGFFIDDMNSYVDVLRNSSAIVDPVRQTLYRWLPDFLVAQDKEHANMRKHRRAMGIEQNEADAPLLPADINRFVDHTARFLVAVVGGGFLLVPIIVMSFTHSQNLRLVVSSIAVLAFSLFLSFLSRATNQEVLAGAAAYAAVMVVFVGSGGPSSS